jgi:ribosomal protein S18 acetylase RimI-like enzyme
MTRVIRALVHEIDASACDAMVAGLPAWFGNTQGITECKAAVRTDDGLVAVEGEEVVGFITFVRHSATSWEITWMAVHAQLRGSGIGSELIAELSSSLPSDAQMLLVKTLSDRDGDPGPEYTATRAFYLARGFRPMAELDVWGPENPCQLLGRRLTLGRK